MVIWESFCSNISFPSSGFTEIFYRNSHFLKD
uniref:Uncharacterized protein n=1 Tax=Arundo donax TaxID=35708 RepID=A0A0A8ZGN9_ARUDO